MIASLRILGLSALLAAIGAAADAPPSLAAKEAAAACEAGQRALAGGEPELAAALLEKATRLAPRNSAFLTLLGEAYGRSAQRAGLLSRFRLARLAIASWDRALALDPDNLRAREDRLSYYRQAPAILGGGKSKAYAEAKEILRRDPARGIPPLCGLLESDKRYAEAFALLDRAIRDHPGRADLLYQFGCLAAASGKRLDEGESALKECLRRTPPAIGGSDIAVAHRRLGDIYRQKGESDAARAEYARAGS